MNGEGSVPGSPSHILGGSPTSTKRKQSVYSPQGDYNKQLANPQQEDASKSGLKNSNTSEACFSILENDESIVIEMESLTFQEVEIVRNTLKTKEI